MHKTESVVFSASLSPELEGGHLLWEPCHGPHPSPAGISEMNKLIWPDEVASLLW